MGVFTIPVLVVGVAAAVGASIGGTALSLVVSLKERMKRTATTVTHIMNLTEGTYFLTGPPNGQVLFCSLASVVCRRRLSVAICNAVVGRAGRRARRRSDGRHYTAGQYGYVPLWRHLVNIVIIKVVTESLWS